MYTADEHPRRRAVVEQLLQPMLDEAAAIRRLPARERSHISSVVRGQTKPSQDSATTIANGRNVSDAKPSVVHPRPVHEIAYDDEQQPYDDKRRDAGMQDQHGVASSILSDGPSSYKFGA